MNKREKTLSIGVGLAAVLFFGFLIYGQISGARSRRLAARTSLTNEIKDAKMDNRKVRREARRLYDFQDRSIHHDATSASNLYYSWLIDQLEQLQIVDPEVKPVGTFVRGARGGKARPYQQLTFTVNADARLDQMTQFLDLFYSQGYLHRIETFTAKPKAKSKQLSFSLKITALVLPQGADRKSLESLPADRVIEVVFKSGGSRSDEQFSELLALVKPFVPWSDQELLDRFKESGKLDKSQAGIRVVGEYGGDKPKWRLAIAPDEDFADPKIDDAPVEVAATIEETVADEPDDATEEDEAETDDSEEDVAASEIPASEEDVAVENETELVEETGAGVRLMSLRTAKVILREQGMKLGADTDRDGDVVVSATGKGIEIEVVSRPGRLIYGSTDAYVKMIGDRNFFAPPNNRPELAQIGDQDAIIGESLDIPVKASDKDELDKLTYRMVSIQADQGDDAEKLTHDSESDEITFDPASGKVAFKSDELGTYRIAIEAVDDGLPKRVSDRQIVAITVGPEPERKPASLDGLELIQVSGITKGSSGRWAVWLKLKTTNRPERLYAGDKFDIGDIQGMVKRVDSRQTELVAANQRLLVKFGQNLSQAQLLGSELESELESEKGAQSDDDANQTSQKDPVEAPTAIIESASPVSPTVQREG